MAQWMTVPYWRDIRPCNVFHREQEPAGEECRAPKNIHALVRGTVELPRGNCELRVCADDHYQLWTDGVYAGQGPAPAYPGRETYDTYPLEDGRKITIALHIYYQGLINRVWNSGDGRFGLWVSVCCDGRETASCDESWLCRLADAYSGGTVGYETQYLEDFDSRLWPEGWELPGCGREDWQNLIPANWMDSKPSPRLAKPLWEGVIPPASRLDIPGGILLDFGGEVAGNLAVSAKGPESAVVTLRFGEELEADGRVRFDMRCNCRYEEHWTLRDGVSILHQYDYKAFRYAELLFSPEVEILDCKSQARHYPMEDSLCALKCPEEELEDIFRICREAVRWCSQDGYLDCASREKGQYLGDAIVTARSQVWLTGSTELLRKCVRDFMASARISPGLMAVAPGSLMQEVADYSLMFPLLPLTDYEFTGDRKFLAECYPVIKSVIEAFGKYRRGDGLLENVSEQWNIVDWPENMRDGYDFPLTRPVVGEGCHNVINAIWYGANKMRERIEKILGLTSENRSEAIGEAFRGAFYRPGQLLFADSETSGHCSLQANLYAAWFGLLPKEAEDTYAALLLTPGRYCGALPMYYALDALGRMGKYEALYRLLTREDEHGWRNMLREGASCCFEAWGRDQKFNTSLCHPWASGPIPLIIEHLAGFRPDPEAEEGYRFEPKFLSRLQEFSLRLPWREGIIKIEKLPGLAPTMERTDRNAVSETE